MAKMPTGTRRRASRGKLRASGENAKSPVQALNRERRRTGVRRRPGRATKQMDFAFSPGFTLLELMISISMLVIIIVIISGAMRLASRSVATAERKVEALERLTTSLSIINAQIQSAAPWTYSDNGLSTQASQGNKGTQTAQPGQTTQSTQSTPTAQPGQTIPGGQAAQGAQGSQNIQGAPKFYFKGDRRSFQFSTNYSVWGGQKGYVIVTYKVEPDPRTGKLSLFASERMVGIEASRQTKLLDGLDDIAFSYFQNGLTAGEPGTWAQDWTSDTTIPAKIRLYLLNGSKERLMVLPIRAKPLTGGA